jgi:hypothetical protein
MNITDVAKTIFAIAPKIATVLGGPLSGLAVAILSSAFGADKNDVMDIFQKVSSAPDRELKLEEIENQHGENLISLHNQRMKDLITDKSSARSFNLESQKTGVPSLMPHIISLTILAGFILIAVVVGMYSNELSPAGIAIVTTIATLLGKELKSITDFYFGMTDDNSTNDDNSD